MARRALTDGSLNFAQNLVIRDGPSTLVVRDDLRLLVDFLERDVFRARQLDEEALQR